jgi:hypothetical protein
MDDADVFFSIVDGAPDARPQKRPAVQDRRRSPRVPLGAVAILVPDLDNVPHVPLQVLVINVSVHGVGFRSPVSFDPGRTYRLRIGTGPLFLTSRMRIASSRLRPDGSYDVGAQFI